MKALTSVCIVVVLVCIMCTSVLAQIDISVTPSTISWDTNTWVDIVMTNLTPGANVRLALVTDIEGDGALDGADAILATFDLMDGEVNPLGSVVMPDDDDGVINGAIETKISYFGVNGYTHIIGSYLWMVEELGGGSTGAVSFAVTQPTSTVWVTGQVLNYATSNAVAGAIVEIAPTFYNRGFAPMLLADTNGEFSMYVPDYFSTNGVRGMRALAPGHFSSPDGPNGESFSAYRFTDNLVEGENALTSSLWVVSSVSGLVYSVTGYLYDEYTNAIAGGMVFFESDEGDGDGGDGDDGGGDGMALGISDTNGLFELSVPDEFVGSLFAGDYVLNMRGYVGGESGTMTISQDVSGLEVYLSSATTLARSQAVEDGSGDPVPGVQVFFESDDAAGTGFTLTNGFYEIGLISGEYESDVEEDCLMPMGYLTDDFYEGLIVPGSGIFTNAYYVLLNGYDLSGTVYNSDSNSIYGGSVAAFTFGQEEWDPVAETDVSLDGYYELLVPTGSYRVIAQNFDGYLNMNWSNHYTWEWDMGPAADPVDVSGDTSGIDFYLTQAAYIRGTVMGGGNPISNVEVIAYDEFDRIDSYYTGTSGVYELEVLSGTNYVVQAEPMGDTFWMFQYYNGKTEFNEADIVVTAIGTPATNINFTLVEGGTINGMLYESDGSTPITNSMGFVEAYATNGNLVNSTMTENDGSYRFTVNAGTYHVKARADGWLSQYYDGWYAYEREMADPVTVQVSQATSGIDFTMEQPSYIEGFCTYSGGGVSGLNVSVFYVPDTNDHQWTFLEVSQTETSGFYQVPVPAGTQYLVRVQNSDGFFIDQYWDNVFKSDEATYVDVAETSTLSNIDFLLIQGFRVEGTVFDENNNPYTQVLVNAQSQNGFGSWEWSGNGNTDENGNFGFPVMAGNTGSVIFVAHPDNTWYPATYYDQKYNIDLGDLLWTNAGSTISGVNIYMYPGALVTGTVYRSDGVTPIGAGNVEAMNVNSNRFGESFIDGMGHYSFIMTTSQPLYVKGGGGSYISEFYSNAYTFADATTIQPAGMTTMVVDFAIYEFNEDSDTDGRMDYQEDTVPDGIFVWAEDWASYTNTDTDTDGYTDYQEWLADTDQKNSNSFLVCANVFLTNDNIAVTWDGKSNVNYNIQRTTTVGDPDSWEDWTPYIGTGGTAVVEDSILSITGHAYRVRVQ